MAVEAVGIALGSNLGNRILHFREALQRIQLFCEGPVLCSSVYETEPVDCPPGSGVFYNAVIEVRCALPPREILARCLEIEKELGRQGPGRQKNSPRPIDLDLLYFGGEKISEPGLEIPHPAISTRAFVLAPLSEIRPGLILPGEARSVAEMLADLPLSSQLKKRSEFRL